MLSSEISYRIWRFWRSQNIFKKNFHFSKRKPRKHFLLSVLAFQAINCALRFQLMSFWPKLNLVTSVPASLLGATPGSLTECIVARNRRQLSCHCRQLTHKICENSKGKIEFLNSQKRKLDLRCCVSDNFGTESLAREPLSLQIVSSDFARKVGGKNTKK